MKKIIVAVFLLAITTVFSFYIKYTVQKGDTLYDLSKNFGIPIPIIIDWNPGLSPTTLKVGSTLTIPLVPGIMYKVPEKMSISELAKYFFLDINEILAVNPSIGTQLTAGRQIFVPVGRVNTSFTQLSDFIWPVYGKITSEFGWRIHPIYGRTLFHTGIDIKVPEGTPVFASRAGTVKFAGWMSGYGNLIIIDHGDYETYYAHLSRINVYVGLRVEKGDFIGRSGNTGTSTGPHLHFEVRKYGNAHDPIAYLPRTNTYVMRRVFSE